MTWVLKIPSRVPSSNERLVNGRDMVSRALYRKLRDQWAADIGRAAWSAQVPRVTEAGPKRRIVLTRIMGPRQRAYDFDDLVGGCKPILDAMKPARPGKLTTIKTGRRKGKQVFLKAVAGAGLILDDSPAWVEVEYRQEKGTAAGCRIELEDVR